jgi:hypothetical protein
MCAFLCMFYYLMLNSSVAHAEPVHVLERADIMVAHCVCCHHHGHVMPHGILLACGCVTCADEGEAVQCTAIPAY